MRSETLYSPGMLLRRGASVSIASRGKRSVRILDELSHSPSAHEVDFLETAGFEVLRSRSLD